MTQLALFEAEPPPVPSALRFRCHVGRCDQPAIDDSEWCASHQRSRPLWPFPDSRCQVWGCDDYAMPFGNGRFCLAHGGRRPA